MNREDEEYYGFNPSLSLGGYNPMQSNQKETINKLNAYSQWANNAPQPQQQKEDSVARAIADISNAVQMSQGGAGQTGNAPAAAQTAPTASAGGLQGVPSYSDMYDAYGDSNINILQRLMQMRGGY